MRTLTSKLFAFALLIIVAQSLAGCVVYDGPHRGYYWHDHDGWRR